ncbi:MAG: CPBP family intramembrane metalloprotease [Planctomycetes bacterium]|nr:CPBP family intramembrane metalloprotease [Planctomycetota bacterium]
MMLAVHPPAWAAADIMIVLAMMLVVELALTAGLSGVLTYYQAEDERLLRLVATLIRGMLVVCIVMLVLWRRSQPIASVGLCWGRWWAAWAVGGGTAVAAFAVLFGTVMSIYVLFPVLRPSLERNAERLFEGIPRLPPVILAVMACLVGFYEEVFFRGFLLTRLRRATGSAAIAIAVVSALFAVAHMSSQEPIAAVPLFLIGVLWALVTLWRMSVVPVIIGHALFNLGQLLYMYYYAGGWT